MQLIWTEKLVRASSHPAFENAEKTQIGEGEYMFDVYPIFQCKLVPPKTLKKTSQQLAYLEDKKEHLSSFGINGEIVD